MPSTSIVVVIGAGSIGQAIARRVSAGKRVVLADLREENTEVGGNGVHAVISGCLVENFGDALFATGDVNATISDSVIAQGDTGIHIATTAGLVLLRVGNCQFSDLATGAVGNDSNNNKFIASYGNNATAFSDIFNQATPLK